MDSSFSASPTAEWVGSADTVLLDVDGTLIDSTYFHALAWIRAFARHDLHPHWWQVHRTIGMGGDLLVGELCGEAVEERLGDTLRAQWADEYRRVLPEVRAFTGVAELISRLRRQGLVVALASSGAAEFTDAAIDLIGVERSELGAVTTSEDADRSKPEPDILSVALEKAGGQSAVLIGDTVWDVESAKRLGSRCVAVRSGGFSTGELSEAGAVLVVDDVAQLAASDGVP